MAKKIRSLPCCLIVILTGWLTLIAPNAMAKEYPDDCLPDSIKSYKVLGKATDLKGKPLYEETLTFSKAQGGQLDVVYVTPQQKPLANKKVDFQCRVTSPNFILRNPQDEVLVSVKRKQDSLLSFDGEAEEPHDFPAQAFIVDAGFDHYVKQNWQALTEGKELKVDFFFPNRQTFFRLKMHKSKAPDAITKQVTDNLDDLVFFKISANNFLFRLFSSPLYIGYDSERNLRHYLGLSNLPMIDESPVLISYQKVN